jgi:DNA repair protein RecO
MKQFSTQGVILSRTDFSEADRILTFITPDHGKVKAIAKGVRKAGAKLAGAIELFSVSELTVITGRGEINTLISARLIRHYDQIVSDISRTNAAYDFLKILNKATEDKTEESFFTLIDNALAALNDKAITPELTDLWFRMQLLRLTGHTPNLRIGPSGKTLTQSKAYIFDFDKMQFGVAEKGDFTADHIKFLRVGFSGNSPKAIQRIEKVENLVKDTQPLIDTILRTYIRI